MTTPLACDLTALTPAERGRHAHLRGTLRRSALGVTPVPDGVTLTFPPDPATVLDLAAFMVLERACCPFLHLALVCPPDGPTELRVGGPPGVLEFLHAELGLAPAPAARR